MLQIIDSLTNPIVIFYNIGIIGLFLLWIYRDRTNLKTKLNNIFIKGNIRKWWIFSITWFIFSLFANFFFLQSDVDDAVMSGTVAFVNGANPYAQNVVVHLLPSGPVLGLYHYFPSDLLVYAFTYIIYEPIHHIFPFLLNSWFFMANCIFLFIGYLFTRKILYQVEDKRLIPIYIFATCFFLFSNSSLLILYFTMGFYFLKKLSNSWVGSFNYDLGVTSYILAAGVKYITGLLLFVQIFEEFTKVRKISDLKLLRPYLLGTIVFIIIILPFGLYNMLNATFLFQLAIGERSQVAGIYGPILIEAVLAFNLLNYYSYIFAIAAVLSILVALKYGKNTYEKQMILSFLFMLILPFYGTEMLIVPILLWLFDIFGVQLNFPETSEHFVKEANQQKSE